MPQRSSHARAYNAGNKTINFLKSNELLPGKLVVRLATKKHKKHKSHKKASVLFVPYVAK
jgi:hypothetical protein